jgi:hypothetical protein
MRNVALPWESLEFFSQSDERTQAWLLVAVFSMDGANALPGNSATCDQPAGVKPGTISNLATSSPIRDPGTGAKSTVTAA